MGRFFTGALVLVACGKVAEGPGAPSADAALDAFACPAAQLACGGTCIDPMTDPMNCGGCGVVCQSAGESCQAGACTDTLKSCADIYAVNASAPDGVYTLVDGTEIGCDMLDGGITIYGLAYGEFDVATEGYQIVSLADFQSTGLQQVFIALYNHQGGATELAAWTAGNCCFKYDTSATTAWLGFGSNFVVPMGSDGTAQCDEPTNALEDLELEEYVTPFTITPEPAPLPTSLFSSFPPGTYTACANATNPAFFWKVMP